MKRLVIAAAVFVVVAAVAIVLLVLPPATGAAGELARHLPPDTLVLVAVDEPQAMLEDVKKLVPPTELAKAIKDLPFDISDAAAWENNGVDMAEPMGFAYLEAEPQGFVWSFATSDEEGILARIPALLRVMDMDSAFRPQQFGPYPGLIADDGVAVIQKGTRILLVTASGPNRSTKLQSLADKLASLDAEDSLAEDEAFEEAVNGVSEARMTVYVNAKTLREVVPFAPMGPEGNMIRAMLAETDGLALGLSESDDGSQLLMRVPLASGSRIYDLYEDADRNPDVFDNMPGPVFLGSHAAYNPDKLRSTLEYFLSLDPRAYRNYSSALEALREKGIDLQGDFLDNLNGEFGVLIDRPSTFVSPWTSQSIAFMNLQDEDKAKALLQRVQVLASGSGFVETRTLMAGETTIHSFSMAPGAHVDFRISVAVQDKRLWLAPNESALAFTLQGEGKSLWDDERSSEVADVLREDCLAAGFLDLRPLIAMIPANVFGKDPAVAQLMRGYLGAMDRVEWKTTLDGRILDFEATLYHADSAPSLASSGITATVAVPAFLKYMRRAKTTEAIDQLDKIYKGAAVYYQTPKIDQRGNRLPCQVPQSQGVTPIEGTCCANLGGPDHDDDGRCDQTSNYWDEPTWEALNFQLNDQHYFVYSFYTNGLTGADMIFTAQANGDLDCDGIQSTFQRIGFGDPNATMSECALQGSAAFYIDQETE